MLYQFFIKKQNYEFSDIKLNYSLSRWMANFGVVPCILFLILRFLPNFFLLLARLILETLVGETTKYLYLIYNYFINLKLLHICLPYVKTVSIIFTLCCTAPATYPADTTKQIILSKGEQRELDASGLKKYSIGSKDIIANKYHSKTQIMLIKGKKIGFTDLIIWKKDKTKIKYHIYVLSKRSQLKIAQLSAIFKKMELETSIDGPLVTITGIVSSLNDYLIIKKLAKKYTNQIFIKATLHNNLKKEIIGDIYFYLYREDYSNISCDVTNITIYCRYSKDSKNNDNKILKELKKKYNINFITTSSHYTKKNYLLKLKLIQIEKKDGAEFSLGLDRFSSSYENIFKNGISSIVFQNKILIQNQQLDISTLASPEIVVHIDQDAKIQIGTEIPFNHRKDNDNTVVQWKFAGLKILLKITRVRGQFILKYTTEFTTPNSANSVSGSKESSSAIIKLNSPIQIFNIGLQTHSVNNGQLPFFSKIPILGNLFISKSNNNNFKKINGLVLLKELSNKE